MCGAPERLPAFGARTFYTVITTSIVQDLMKKSLACRALIEWYSTGPSENTINVRITTGSVTIMLFSTSTVF
jgi:hypothetical protein